MHLQSVERDNQPRILCPVKLLFKNEEISTTQDEEKIREAISTYELQETPVCLAKLSAGVS
jgi:hypothetical protein